MSELTEMMSDFALARDEEARLQAWADARVAEVQRAKAARNTAEDAARHLRSQRDDLQARNTELVEQRRAVEADRDRLRGALAEVSRRAALPINVDVSGLPETPHVAEAAIEECCRLALNHVAEPARAALAAGGDRT